MMKNVYMVQASNIYSGNSFKAAYLPYAVGLLVAYAFSDEKIKEEYEFKRFIFTRENTDNAVQSLDSPFIIGFSNYIWNTEYNLCLARKIKDKFPECKILFGGHNIPPDSSFLDQYPFIDFLIHSEGEEAFKGLLLELASTKPQFENVPNLSYRDVDGAVVNNPVEVLTKTDYPSPYLMGLFDSIFEENPDMQLDAILETSRGCPRSCTYCDWGCNSQKIKLFPIQRVFDEIDWMAAHNVKFIWGADANFGAYERDDRIVDYLIKTREKTGCPERLRINYSMTHHEAVFKINRKLEKYGLSKEGATLSFQSLNPETLESIGRKNMSLEKFSGLISMYKKEGVTTYSELIIGLPRETYASFCKGIGQLLAAGQHRLITAYNCEILPNAPMAQPEYMKKYGIKTATVEHLVAHTVSSDVGEKSHYIVETDTLSREDWIRCNIFACVEESYHHLGILKFISIYLFKQKGIAYEDFYNKIIDCAKTNPDGIIKSVYDKLYVYFKGITLEKPVKLYSNKLYGNITWVPGKLPHLDTIYRLDGFYEEITPVLYELGVEKQIVDELVKYEKTALKYPRKNNFSEDFEYNWHDYFTAVLQDDECELVKKKNSVSVHNEFVADNWKDYALQSTWFGKDGTTFNLGMSVRYY